VALVTRQIYSGQRDQVGVYVAYDDATLDVRAIRVRNGTAVPVLFRIQNPGNGVWFEALTAPGSDATQALPRNRYTLTFDAEGSPILPTMQVVSNPA
jgi:hypothetical protein